MPSFREFSFSSSNGADKLYACKCLPDTEAKAIIQIAHGVCDHIARYGEFMDFLAANGYIVAGNDHLGHGKNIKDESSKGYFADENGWDYVVSDIDSLRDILCAEHPNIPYILFGHSMGSFLARSYAIKYPDKYSALILSGTGHMPAAMINAGYALSQAAVKKSGTKKEGHLLNKIAFGSYNNRIENPRTEFDWISSCADEVDKYIADPCCGFVCKTSLYRDMMAGIRFITKQSNINKMNKQPPVLFFAGKDDPVGEYGAGVERAYKAFCKAGIRDIFMKLYPGGRHEMLNEVNKAQVYEDILQWIEMRLPTL